MLHNKLDVFFFVIIIGAIIFGVNLQYEPSTPQFVMDQAVFLVVSVSHIIYVICVALYCIRGRLRTLQTLLLKVFSPFLRSRNREYFTNSLPQQVEMDRAELLQKEDT